MEARDLVAGTTKLISVPEVYLKINEMVDDPKASAMDIGNYISRDPALTARLLKIANSPFYGFPSQISSVSRAITVIGTRGLRDLALAMSTISTFSKLPVEVIDLNAFWRHSLFCAVTSRLLAKQCNALQTEPFFVAGLMHDIGQLIIMNKIPEMAIEAHLRAKNTGLLLSNIENEIMGFNHAEVGEALFRKWKLPESTIDSIANHHTPDQAKDSPLGAAIVHIADSMAKAEEMPYVPEENLPHINEIAWKITGLDKDALADILEEARAQYKISIDLFLTKAA
ncbi:MAG: HDOD domain-containing protein [Gammaproteobacteria bacterium]